jgi:hypothetical protein
VFHTFRHGSLDERLLLLPEGLDPEVFDGPCVRCNVRPGEYHHLACCAAICGQSDRQSLMCECDRCEIAHSLGMAAEQAARGDVDIAELLE